MKPAPRPVVLAACAGLAVLPALAQRPNIGYAYPAGGRQGTSLEVEVGGQHLALATNVLVSGEGVVASVGRYSVKYEPRVLRSFYRNRDNSLATLKERKEKGEDTGTLERRIEQLGRQITLAELPEGVDPENRRQVFAVYAENTKEQFNPQIADRLRIDVRIAKNAPPGERELRVYTPNGLSNPIFFEVGVLDEVLETEPNDDHMGAGLQQVPVPSYINGQIMPGDIDHFTFKAQRGQSIVVDVGARRILPYLADAVPGWFQAVVALYDEDGNEVAYADDYKFHPDPVLFFDVPRPGTYTLSIRDAIYRGREDFIYRIALGELPFITSLFPLGARQGADVDIELSGRNLPVRNLTGKLPDNGLEARNVSVKKGGYRSNQLPFAIGELPEIFENEPNDTEAEAQPVRLPVVVNGRIQAPGDADVFSFQGRKGDTVAIEVAARRLLSPLDSVVSLSGPGMEEPVRNDDHVAVGADFLFLGAGLVTHHADSYLIHELPNDGTYFVQIGDAQFQGGNDFGYRLRISPATPDFKLRMEPSGQQIAPGGTAAFSVRALRRDGFEGKIALEVENLPDGYGMSPVDIPAGADSTRFTITAPKKIAGRVVSPSVFGKAEIGGRPVRREAVPVDDQMQAFLYRHLVPAQELVLAPVAKPPPVAFEARLPKSGVIELPLDGEIRLALEGTILQGFGGAAVKVDTPPDGLSFEKGWVGPKRLKEKGADGKHKVEKGVAVGQIVLKAEAPLKPGDRVNLVLVAAVRRGREEILYPAPAIPVRVVKPGN